LLLAFLHCGFMAGGAQFSPKLLVDGKRPFHLYPPAHRVLGGALWMYASRPVIPTLAATAVWPLYHSAAQNCRARGLNEAGFFSVALCGAVYFTYASINGFYTIIEYNRWLEKYKIARHYHHIPSRRLVLSTLKAAVVGKIALVPTITYYVLTKILKWRGMNVFGEKPTLKDFYLHFLAAVFVNDIGFYWAHRISHHPLFYARVHKQHHEWKGTVSYAAEYASPAEQLFANYIPTLGGCLLIRSHPFTMIMWVCERLRHTYEYHCGYAFKGLLPPIFEWFGVTNWKSAADHDFHHTSNSGNFGTSWLDWLHGTMDSYAVAGLSEAYYKELMDGKLSYMHADSKKG